MEARSFLKKNACVHVHSLAACIAHSYIHTLTHVHTHACTFTHMHTHAHSHTSTDPSKKAVIAEEDIKGKPPPPEEKMEVEGGVEREEEEEEETESGEEDNEEDEESDDPDKLWCICREPHDDRLALPLLPSTPSHTLLLSRHFLNAAGCSLHYWTILTHLRCLHCLPGS